MTVSGLNGLLSSGATSSGVSTTTSSKDAQDSFMKMLIAQLRNQDPLNPMDNAQMTSQLAQLNMVSGINQLNSTLSNFTNTDMNAKAISAAGLLGREVLVPGNGLQLQNGQAKFGFELSEAVDNLNISVYDSQGNAIHTQELGAQKAGVQALSWDGSTDSGVPAIDGSYIFKIDAQLAGKEANVTALTVGGVQNISLNAGVLKANVGKAGDVSLSDIKQIF